MSSRRTLSNLSGSVGSVFALALALASPLVVAACGDAPIAPVKAPPQAKAPTATPAGQQIGMSDAPTSVKPGDVPEVTSAPGRPSMNGPATAAYQQAFQAFGAGDLVQARTLFTQATAADPQAYQAFYSLGVVQERLRDAGAGGSYRQAYTIVPDYEPAIIAYAMLLARKGQLPDAERVLTEKRTQMANSAAIAATLAEIKSLQKDTGSAQRLAQEALKLNPDYRPAMVVIARDHYRNRRLDLALYALTAILDGIGEDSPPRDKDNAEALLLRGLIYREQGNRGGAMDQFRKAFNKRPDLVEARVQLSTYLLEAGSADEALPMLEGAVKYDNDNLPAHLNLGDCYRLLGRYGDAKHEFEWVVNKNEALPQVHYDLGLLYLFAPSVPGSTPKQQVDEATKELKRFQELRSKDEHDDSDELLTRAKLKESEITAQAAAPAAPAATAVPAASVAPAASAAPAAAPTDAPSAAPAAPPPSAQPTSPDAAGAAPPPAPAPAPTDAPSAAPAPAAPSGPPPSTAPTDAPSAQPAPPSPPPADVPPGG